MRRTRWALALLACFAVTPVWAEDVSDHARALKRHAKEPFEQREREKAIRGLAKIATPEAARALMPIFDDPFVHLHDRAVSAWIDMLRKNRGGDLHTFFEKVVLRDREAAVRKAAATAMCLTSTAELATAVRDALKSEKDKGVMIAWARGVMNLRGYPEFQGALTELLKHKDGDVVYAAAPAVARFESDCVPAFRKALRHKAPQARAGAVLGLLTKHALTEDDIARVRADKAPASKVMLALRLELAAQEHEGKTALPWPGAGETLCAELLADPSWRVRVAAIQGALRVWHPKLIHLLIKRLQTEQDPRVRDDLHRALVTYTQIDVGTDADLWISWWSANGARFVPGDRPEADKFGRIRWRPALHNQAKEGTKSVVFFDVPLTTSRVAFVFDLSGSMRNDSGIDGKTKLQMLQERFAEALEQLPKGTRFDLVVYRYPSGYPPKPKLTRALGKLQPLSKRSVSKATDWLEKQPAKGWGAFHEPLVELLAEDVDTIVLLSDGRPSRGVYDRDFRILQEFPYANFLSRVQVNTILVGTKGADQKFMQNLADATGGRFQSAGK